MAHYVIQPRLDELRIGRVGRGETLFILGRQFGAHPPLHTHILITINMINDIEKKIIRKR
jgi:hypothetical protein